MFDKNFNGKGTRSKDGNVYEGQFVNGAAHGKGFMKYENLFEYDGEWVNDQRSGKGLLMLNYVFDNKGQIEQRKKNRIDEENKANEKKITVTTKVKSSSEHEGYYSHNKNESEMEITTTKGGEHKTYEPTDEKSSGY